MMLDMGTYGSGGGIYTEGDGSPGRLETFIESSIASEREGVVGHGTHGPIYGSKDQYVPPILAAR